MTEAEVIDICREGIMVAIKIGGPIMLVAMVVGVVISITQTITQIQEPTVTFVPKILAVFFACIVLAPFMLTTLQTYAATLGDQIVRIGAQ